LRGFFIRRGKRHSRRFLGLFPEKLCFLDHLHFGPESYTLIIAFTSARASSSFETTDGQSIPRCFLARLISL
jgi:hypothetical protein